MTGGFDDKVIGARFDPRAHGPHSRSKWLVSRTTGVKTGPSLSALMSTAHLEAIDPRHVDIEQHEIPGGGAPPTRAPTRSVWRHDKISYPSRVIRRLKTSSVRRLVINDQNRRGSLVRHVAHYKSNGRCRHGDHSGAYTDASKSITRTTATGTVRGIAYRDFDGHPFELLERHRGRRSTPPSQAM